MINGYSVTTLLMAVPTAFAVFAPSRSRQLARASFRLGMVINEIPFYPALWLLAATIRASFDGALAGSGGLVGLVVAVATTVGLGVIAARALTAGPALDGALRAAGITDHAVLERLSWRQLLVVSLVPLVVRRRGVRRIGNVAYGPHGRRNLLDVYSSTAPRRSAPVLVYFHGGGYFSGRKSKEARLLLYRLARRGWVCVSAAYRLRPAAGFDDHLTDLAAVLAWVREYAAEYGGDPARIVLAGSSAGAHLGSIAALTARSGDGSGMSSRPFAAVVCLYGYYGYYYGLGPGGEISSNPVDHVHPAAPSFFIVHGDRDTCVPVEGAREFVSRLRAVARNPVVYAELSGAQHAFDLFRSLRFDRVVDAVEIFLDRVVSGSGGERR